jgi:hypothetical protein
MKPYIQSWDLSLYEIDEWFAEAFHQIDEATEASRPCLMYRFSRDLVESEPHDTLYYGFFYPQFMMVNHNQGIYYVPLDEGL